MSTWFGGKRKAEEETDVDYVPSGKKVEMNDDEERNSEDSVLLNEEYSRYTEIQGEEAATHSIFGSLQSLRSIQVNIHIFKANDPLN